ncbi:hypothetical protein [Candidatus Methylomirabilis sp.]|uniref:hypothetical protein n=1 Tax=Candidatus Methylomirabilis sp. TaxID=2032687 RepID=UPI0030765F0A
MSTRYIMTNFAYGFGPFLRTTELALATCDILSKGTGETFGVIVPWVYGESQKQILLEEFGDVLKEHPGAIVLDKRVGAELELIFYGEKGYAESLKYYHNYHERVTDDINNYIAKGIITETFDGEPISIERSAISLCISRAPRVYFDIEPSYYTSFGYVSEILERSLEIPEIAPERELCNALIPLSIDVEKRHRLHFIADPATFSYLGERPPRYGSEVLTPPNAFPPKEADCSGIELGIFVSITGIPGLQRLFQEAHQLGFRFYSNKPQFIPGAVRALPRTLRCKNISLHFARAGWGSIWYSQFTGVPLVVPKHDPHDDPEIYFNNICIEQLGIGKVYAGQPLADLLAFSDTYKAAADRQNRRIETTYGTINGIAYTAERIAMDYLGSLFRPSH